MNDKETYYVKDASSGRFAEVVGFEGFGVDGEYILKDVSTGSLFRKPGAYLSQVRYGDIPYWYWLKPETPTADEPRRVEASPEVDLKEIRIHSEILSRLLKQTVKGVKKYGDPVHHDNLTAVEWIDHAIDESVDQIVYLTALKHKLLAAEEAGKDEHETM